VIASRLLAILMLVLVPAEAEAFSINVINQSHVSITGLNLFPIDRDDDPIEDNLGGFIDPLPKGGMRRVEIDADCGPLLAVFVLGNGDELRADFDACEDTTLKVQ
jgi:hypothetical protein